MRLIRYRPSAPLDAYVECFWWSQRGDSQTACEYMLPGGSAQLIFALHESPMVCLPNASSAASMTWSRGVLHGPQWSFYLSGPKPRGAVAGVSFHPGGAGAILGIPATEIVDRHITLDALWGSRGGELRERLLAAKDPLALFRVLERDLIAHLTRPLLIHPVVARALAFDSTTWGSSRVAAIQCSAGYSPRHFIALFRASVGLTPKHYYRVKRFTTVLRHLAKEDVGSLADLAASVGYSDQSHMTREFREFAGITPTQYRPSTPGSILHHRASG
jgi:AraC-like DNA-binding protein